jgi:hypothetical protein
MTAATRQTKPSAREIARKAATAAFEALPALLLAAALLAPAVAAFAVKSAAPAELEPQALEVRTELSIPEQGNRALIEIRLDAREALRRDVTLPELS